MKPLFPKYLYWKPSTFYLSKLWENWSWGIPDDRKFCEDTVLNSLYWFGLSVRTAMWHIIWAVGDRLQKTELRHHTPDADLLLLNKRKIPGTFLLACGKMLFSLQSLCIHFTKTEEAKHWMAVTMASKITCETLMTATTWIRRRLTALPWDSSSAIAVF